MEQEQRSVYDKLTLCWVKQENEADSAKMILMNERFEIKIETIKSQGVM